jgi:hypothetical protein
VCAFHKGLATVKKQVKRLRQNSKHAQSMRHLVTTKGVLMNKKNTSSEYDNPIKKRKRHPLRPPILQIFSTKTVIVMQLKLSLNRINLH